MNLKSSANAHLSSQSFIETRHISAGARVSAFPKASISVSAKADISSEGSTGEGSDSEITEFLEVQELVAGSHSHFFAMLASGLLHQSV